MRHGIRLLLWILALSIIIAANGCTSGIQRGGRSGTTKWQTLSNSERLKALGSGIKK